MRSDFRRFILLFFTSLACTFFTVSPALAFTLSGGRWFQSQTTYVVDQDFANQGTGWTTSVQDATGNLLGWKVNIISINHTLFDFNLDSNSSNHIRTATSAECSNPCIMNTLTSTNILGYFLNYTMRINVIQGNAYYDGTQTPTIPSNYYDLDSMLRHEFGHVLGLCHTGTAYTLMSAGLSPGEIRYVDGDAIQGARRIYWSGTTPPEAPSCVL